MSGLTQENNEEFVWSVAVTLGARAGKRYAEEFDVSRCVT